MGLGDVKLLAAGGGFVGPGGVLVALLSGNPVIPMSPTRAGPHPPPAAEISVSLKITRPCCPCGTGSVGLALASNIGNASWT